MTNNRVTIVTGGAGFIGSHMVDLLIDNGHQVHVIDNLQGGRESNIAHHLNNPKFSFTNIDIRELDKKSPIFKNAKYVCHFAGIGDIVPSIEKPLDYIDVNLNGTIKVLECSRYAGIEKFVYAASSSCYGIAEVPTNEKHKIQPEYPYALSKYLGEQAAFHWNKVYGIPVNSIRIFNAYGTRSRTSGAYGAVFGVFLRQKIENKPLTVVGDGSQRRDFLYVTDVASAFLAALETEMTGEIWNLGASNPQSVNKIVELLDSEVTYIPKRPGEPECTFADTTKIRNELNWKDKVSFEDGVKNLLLNIDYWKNAPLWTPDTIAIATKSWFKYLDD
ncbi:MAG: NAD-dependent epimerase/dehydratase family protein [Pseudomonadota bacterium]|nr:NAD-dependent epimerase/dehydratase family protein [Pseudomonadota bacterium]